MKLEALEFEFPAQTVENEKSKEEEVERRKECAVGFVHLLQMNSFFYKVGVKHYLLVFFMVRFLYFPSPHSTHLHS